MARILVTGFKPFLGNQVNPTESLSSSLGGEVLEVSYEAVDAFLRERDLSSFDLVLCLGLHAKSECPRLERFAYNEIGRTHPDVRGFIPPASEIEEGGEGKRMTDIDVDALSLRLREKGYGCQPGEDPGRYLCNYIYYGTLGKTGGKALFIHMPPIGEEWTLPRMRAFLDEVLSSLA